MDRIKDKYPLKEIVSHTFPLEGTAEAVKAVRGWKVIKAAHAP
jgi:hypothetical protein